jgi:PAS domain S-box-containing protein
MPGNAMVNGRAPESQEREIALQRGGSLIGTRLAPLCAPHLPGLDADLVFTLLAENVRDYAIFLADADGIIRCWGEGARLMKWWTRQQAEGAHLRLLYPDGGAEDGTAESHLRAATQKGEYNGEGHRVRSDGSTFWAYVTLTALRNAAGDLVGFTKVTRDFSARRAVESALLRERSTIGDAQQALDEAKRIQRLTANLSHELRSPVNTIMGSVALLSADAVGTEKDRKHIERLQRSCRHMMAMIDDVLAIARADADQLPVTPAVRRLGSVVEEALADVEATAGAEKLTAKNAVSGGAGDLPYWGDEGRVRQILVNLLSNAIKFTEPGGSITISGGTGEQAAGTILSGAGPWVYVRVEDTGRGIRDDRIAMIFEPFQQSEIADQQRGTGLGLSISRQFARVMGGDLTVESQVGVGSRFTLWLPIAASEPVPR